MEAPHRMIATATTPLRAIRKAKKQTLDTVAAATGTDAGNLSRIERGIQTPSSRLAKAIAKHFGSEITEAQIMCPWIDLDAIKPWE